MKVGRIAQISKVFLEEGLGWGTEDQPNDPHEEKAPASTDAERARRLRRALERLGPTFVKFGQLLATRVDLFSEEFLTELQKLRSHVPPFSGTEARALIETELGHSIDEVFSVFPEQPAASASIAQVYRAQLRSDGTWVAVKVQRPLLQESLLSDLDVLVQISKVIDRWVPAYRRSMVHHVASEYAARARTEIDFLAEARAMGHFRAVIAELPLFYAPQVFLGLCTPRLLVMEWLDGELLDSVPSAVALKELGHDPCALSRSMLELQLRMSYEHGFVHGDTHPGNLVLMPNGQVGLLDFGLHGHVSRQLCDKMLELLYYQTNGQVDDSVAAFVHIFAPSGDLDSPGFEEELREILKPRPAPTAKESRLTAQLIDGLRLGARYRLQAQSELFLVLRNLTIVEGLILQYCPELDVVSAARSITSGILKRRAFGGEMGAELHRVLPMLLLTLSQRPQLIERLLRLERSFTEARDLGDFLHREGVRPSQRAPAAESRAVWWVLLGLLLGALLVFAAMEWARFSSCADF